MNTKVIKIVITQLHRGLCPFHRIIGCIIGHKTNEYRVYQEGNDNINLEKGYKFASLFMEHIHLVPSVYFYDEVVFRKM